MFFFSEFAASGFAGLAMVFIATPNEGLKIHCQDGKTLGQIFQEKTKGQRPTRVIRNFYSGFVPTALRDVPYVMLYFPFYEELRRKFTPVGQEPTTRKLIIFAPTLSGFDIFNAATSIPKSFFPYFPSLTIPIRQRGS